MASKIVKEGIAHIQASFNNTIITVTNLNGDSVGACSAGACGFKGARKATAFAAQQAAEKVARLVVENNKMEKIAIRISGPGQGRESAARAFSAAGLDVVQITDCTPNPHNGCKRKKKRRV